MRLRSVHTLKTMPIEKFFAVLFSAKVIAAQYEPGPFRFLVSTGDQIDFSSVFFVFFYWVNDNA